MRALALADEVYVGAVARADSLKADERFDTEGLIQFLETQGVTGHTAPSNGELLELLKQQTQTSDSRPQLVVFFTNGSFDGIIGEYVTHVSS